MIPFSGPYTFRSLTYAADGTHIAAINESVGSRQSAGAVWIWDPRNPDARPSSFLAPSGGIDTVAYSPDGSRLATAGESGVLVWDLGHADSQPTLSQPRSGFERFYVSPNANFAYSADLAHFAFASDIGETLRLWDLRSPDVRPTLLNGHPRSGPSPLLTSSGGSGFIFTSMALSRDGARVAAASGVKDNSTKLSVWDVRNADAPAQLVLSLDIPGFRPLFSSVVFSPDDVHLAVRGSIVHIVDMRTPNAPPVALGSPLSRPMDPLAFSDDGRRLAVGRSFDGMQVWDLRNPGAQPLLFQMPTPAQIGIDSAAFSADGSRLAATARTGRTAVWDLRNPSAPAEQFEGASALAFSPDSARLAIAPQDAFVQILDLRTPSAPALELPLPSGTLRLGEIVALGFSPDGTRLTAGNYQGQVATWRLWSAAAEYLCSRVWRNFSADEWRHYVGEGIPYERTCPRLPSGTGAPN
jgi:WD40 repeat protein